MIMNGYIAPAQISGLNPNINTNISIIITGKSANTTISGITVSCKNR